MKFQVIKPFKDGNLTRSIGDIIDIEEHRAMKLLQYKLIGFVKEKTVIQQPVEKAVIEPKYLGGGYYELADGSKIRGKENAKKAINGGG